MNIKKMLPIALLIAASSSAQATTYLGSWTVDQGATWGSQPLAYSGLQAAESLFFSVTGDSNPLHYAVSTIDSSINNQAWYSVIGYSGGVAFADNYLSTNSSQASGYYYSGNSWRYGDVTEAASAYVLDNASGTTYTNYAFYLGNVAAVPEPETYALMGVGLLGLLAANRKKRKHQTVSI
jgi:hypothetical protein